MTGLSGLPGSSYRFVGCALRNTGDGTGWQPIADDTHKPTGVPQVQTTSTRISLVLSFQAAGIVSFAVTPDETLSKAGILSGASVKLTGADITLTRGDGETLDPRTIDTVRYPWSNLWVWGVFLLPS